MSWQRFGLVVLIAALWGAPGAISAQERSPIMRPAVAGCPVCEAWAQAGLAVAQAKREIGKLPHGVVLLYHAERPQDIEPLIRFAYERAELSRQLADSPELRATLGGICGHNREVVDPDLRIEISSSAHGFFAILTSANKSRITMLQMEAKRSVQLDVPWRF